VFSRILFKVVINVVLRMSKCFASFATFAPFLLLNEMMSYFIHNGILLLFNNAPTAPPRLSIKRKTITTIRAVASGGKWCPAPYLKSLVSRLLHTSNILLKIYPQLVVFGTPSCEILTTGLTTIPNTVAYSKTHVMICPHCC